MVKGFVEQSGGRMVIKSELHRGTTVELWLPIAEGKAIGVDVWDGAYLVKCLKKKVAT
jgi:hypothetical protein